MYSACPHSIMKAGEECSWKRLPVVLPVIVSNRGATIEVVDKSVAVIVEPTLSKIKKAIGKLYNNQDFYQTLKNNSVKYVHNNFSAESVKLITKHYFNSH